MMTVYASMELVVCEFQHSRYSPFGFPSRGTRSHLRQVHSGGV